MRRHLFFCLFFMFIAMFNYAYCQDDLLAVDVFASKQEAEAEAGADEAVFAEKGPGNGKVVMQEQARPDDDLDQRLRRIRAFRELLENRQKELEIIRLDLEKSELLLKKKEAEKQIYEIDQTLPRAQKGFTEAGAFMQEPGEPALDTFGMKLQLILISDELKEGLLSLKGTAYAFKQGDSIAAGLFVEAIDPAGVSLRQPDGSLLRLNFLN